MTKPPYELLERRLAEAERTISQLSDALNGDARRLWQNAHQLTLTIESIGDGVITTGLDLRIQRMNATAERMTGWPISDAEGRTLDEIFHTIHAHNRTPRENPAQQVLSAGHRFGLADDIILISRFGKQFHISDSASPIVDPRDGTIHGVVLVFQDRSEAHALRSELETSERHFRELYENAPFGIFTTHVKGYALGVNPAMARILEAPSSAHALAHYRSLQHDLYADPQDREHMLKVLREEKMIRDFLFQARTMKGNFRWLKMDALLSPGDPAQQVIEGFCHDVTLLREEQARRLQREENSRIMLGEMRELLNAPREKANAIVHQLLGRLGELCGADRSYLFRFRSSRGTMTNTHEWCAPGISSHIGELQDMPVADFPCYAKQIMRGETIKITDVRDLPESWAREREIFEAQHIKSLLGIPLFAEGRFFGFAGFDSVQTQRDWNPEESYLLASSADLIVAVLRRAEADLERAELVIQLREARDVAEAANRAKDDFLAIMSHEMRTPLNPIMGFAELMMETTEDPQERGFLEIIRQAAARQLGLIDSILNFSRLNRGAVNPVFSEFCLYEACQDALMAAEPLAHHLTLQMRNGTFHAEVPESMVVYAEQNMLAQILSNLLQNACKYTKDGQVTLHLGLEQRNDQCYFQACVEDTGPGIDTDLQERLFQPFVQADTSLTREFEGAGLGLAICNQLVRTLGGSICVDSEIGLGSRFYVELPVQVTAASEAQLESVPREEWRLSHPLHVLIVEDRRDNALYAAAVIQRLGGTSEHVDSGDKAIEVLETKTYDAVLLDIGLPKVDGVEIARRLRRSAGPNQDIPLVAVTADARISASSADIDAAIDHVLHKPVTPSALLKVLDNLRVRV